MQFKTKPSLYIYFPQQTRQFTTHHYAELNNIKITHLSFWTKNEDYYLISDLIATVATHYELDDGGNRVPIRARFSSLVQNSPRGHRLLYCGLQVCLPGVNLPEYGVDYPPTSRGKVKRRVELYIYCNSGSSLSVFWWTLTL